MIKINVEKAKEIKKEHLRKERKSLLEQLDVEMMRALESNNSQKQSEIAAKKQALRDATKHASLEQVSNLEDLKALKLEDLL
jgi:hypothetical protein